MLVVSIDTSMLQGSLGWIRVGDDSNHSVHGFAECIAPAKPGHAETLIPRLEDVLGYGGFTLGDVDLIVFGRGPGTFTGLRIGLSTIKGIAIGNDCKVVGISSLLGLALISGFEGRVASLIDARRGELFGAIFEVLPAKKTPTAKRIGEEWVRPVDEVINVLNEESSDQILFVTGNGVPIIESKLDGGWTHSLVPLPIRNWAPSPHNMALFGLTQFMSNGPDDIDSVVPNYLREPDAKPPK